MSKIVCPTLSPLCLTSMKCFCPKRQWKIQKGLFPPKFHTVSAIILTHDFGHIQHLVCWGWLIGVGKVQEVTYTSPSIVWSENFLSIFGLGHYIWKGLLRKNAAKTPASVYFVNFTKLRIWNENFRKRKTGLNPLAIFCLYYEIAVSSMHLVLIAALAQWYLRSLVTHL